MLKINSAVSIENILTKQIHKWETHPLKIRQMIDRSINITISRAPFSRGGQVADFLAGQLNWHVFDKEIVDYVAGNANLRREMIEQFDEKNRHEIGNMLAAFMDSHMIDNARYVKLLAEAVISIGRHGQSIILGRGANFILPSRIAFKVHIVDSIEHRLENFIHQFPNKNIKHLKVLENERREFIKRHYSREIADPSHYDLVINLAHMDVPAAGKTILCGLIHKFDLDINQLHANGE